MKPKKQTAKTKPVKAKRYYKTASGTLLYQTLKQAQYFNAPNVALVAVLPCDKASVEAMVKQMANAIAPSVYDACAIDSARAALAAIGIKGGI